MYDEQIIDEQADEQDALYPSLERTFHLGALHARAKSHMRFSHLIVFPPDSLNHFRGEN